MERKETCRLIFWGTPKFAVPTLQALAGRGTVAAVITQPDRPQGRGRRIMPGAVRSFAAEHGIPVLQPETFDASFDRELAQYLPATFLVIAYGRIIPEAVLQRSERPALNVHPSLLPGLRGPSPIQEALLGGYSETGISLIQLDKEMDHGPVMAQQKVAIGMDDTQETLSDTLSAMAVACVLKSIDEYCAGRLAGTPQDHSRATFSKLLTAKDGLLDLSRPAGELHNRVRALNPRPGTYLMAQGKRLKILAAKPLQGQQRDLFSKDADGRLLVRCSQGSLLALTVQAENGRPMDSKDFLNGHPELLSVS